MSGLLLGPVLRHVDSTSATIWVEAEEPAEVTVELDGADGASAHTFQVEDHHYALVVLRGLPPDSSLPYTVRLDGEQVWPPADHDRPVSRIRTPATGTDRFRIVFGSCRKPHEEDALGLDALGAYARRMATRDEGEWPQSLLMLGDQIYADEPTDDTKRWLATRRDPDTPPGGEIANFEEYTHLYHEAWREPTVRWLLSTVPTSMIFDDHDVRDDWNTSQTWRDEMARLSWWPERIRGALMSYWVYQHLGNLDPEDLDGDDFVQEVFGSGEDNAKRLRAFADHADEEVDGAKGTRWSYRRDFGPVRLLVIDSRAGRILAGGARSMVGENEFRWIEAQVDGDYDHLMVGTSLPWLMPNALSHLQSVNEQATRKKGRTGRFAEWARQFGDLEHWPAFRASFERLGALLHRVADGPVATISVLSGDVHHAYVARVRYRDQAASPVYQLTCSPLHNTVPWYMRTVFRIGWWEPFAKVTRWWAHRHGIDTDAITWRRMSGPHFGNMVMTVDVSGREAWAVLEKSTDDGLQTAVRVPLHEQ
jgi:hypothetical protein